MNPRINDVVSLLEDLPEEGLSQGALGTVVAVFSEPQEANEVECCDENGKTLAQLALGLNQFSIVFDPDAKQL